MTTKHKTNRGGGAPLWDSRRVHAFQRALLSWYRSCARDLPWRRTRDPYRIWVSEIMLQQTRVAAVLPFYERFLERFPTIRVLADCPIEEVLPYWSGLGYYRRIRNLHQAAILLVREHDGLVPDSRDRLLALPGIGFYTAGAILSIAFGQAEPVLDGNVRRVYCRLFAVEQDPASGQVQKMLWNMARHVLPREESGDFNQSLMELGASLCTPDHPDCRLCPVSKFCLAAESGRQKQIPFRRPPAARVPEERAIVLLQYKNRILLVRKDKKALVRGLWELPSGPCRSEPAATTGRRRKTCRKSKEEEPSHPNGETEASFPDEMKNEYGCRISRMHKIGLIRHSIMQRDIRLHVYHARCNGPQGDGWNRWQEQAWILPQEVHNYGVSSAALKAIRLWEKFLQSQGQECPHPS